ncbi:MAG: hypothetical protein JO133_13970 [Burkholderiaceae bacterium]|nr:hypothetical protein [Burkholderiaceae bacterium]
MLRWALALLTALAASGSLAQVSGTASIASDDRFRGVSLTHGRPAAQMEVTYDDASGWYAGAFGSNVEFDPADGQQAQISGYGGYALRLQRGWSADAGAAYSTFSKDSDYRYLELHAGVSNEAASARLYYSPNYFGGSIHTLYAELNGSYRISERFRLIGHAGLLQAFSGATDRTGGTHPHADFLAGAEIQIAALRLQLGRVFADGANSIYPVVSDQAHGVLVARLSWSF